ncbi:MAG: hypothetical protein U1F43_38445 [Myxococcota bacterium]
MLGLERAEEACDAEGRRRALGHLDDGARPAEVVLAHHLDAARAGRRPADHDHVLPEQQRVDVGRRAHLDARPPRHRQRRDDVAVGHAATRAGQRRQGRAIGRAHTQRVDRQRPLADRARDRGPHAGRVEAGRRAPVAQQHDGRRAAPGRVASRVEQRAEVGRAADVEAGEAPLELARAGRGAEVAVHDAHLATGGGDAARQRGGLGEAVPADRQRRVDGHHDARR